MTEEELALFNAIKNKNIDEIKRLVTAELKNIKGNLPRKINSAIQDQDGKTFAHYAVMSGRKDIFDLIINAEEGQGLRCPLNIRDRNNKLPKDYVCIWFPYNGKIIENITRDNNRIKIYQDKLNQIATEEIETKSYRKGIVFTSNFMLFYGSSKNRMACPVPDKLVDETSKLSIHELQSIAEAFLVNKANHISQLSDKLYFHDNGQICLTPLTGTNYVLGNVGCIISDKPHKKGGSHQRIFITAPILLKDKLYTKPSTDNSRPDPSTAHSETGLIEVFKSESELMAVFEHLFKVSNIDPKSKRVYSVIFDLHSSQDICEPCENNLFQTQEKSSPVMQNVHNVFQKMEVSLPEKHENYFKVIFRVSSPRPPNGISYRKKLEFRDDSQHFGREHTHSPDIQLDIRTSEQPLIIYSDRKMMRKSAEWYNKEHYAYRQLNFFSLPKYTIFVTQQHKGEEFEIPIEIKSSPSPK